ncbi:MAG: hypothetical protein R3A79_09685 [Nannocystaceae bacterium]
MPRRNAPTGSRSLLLGALLVGASCVWLSACKTPEVRACEDFVDVLRECTDRNGSASGEGEDEDYAVCEDVHPDCEAFFDCAAEQPCSDDNSISAYTIDVSACEVPEGVFCLPR